MFLKADFIYFTPIEQGLDIGAPNDGSLHAEILNMDFKYKPGFRVGLGFDISHDDWQIFAEYMRLYTTLKKEGYPLSGGTIFPYWLDSANLLDLRASHAKAD